MVDDSAQGPVEVLAGDEPRIEHAEESAAGTSRTSMADREVSRPMLLTAIVPLLGVVAWQGPTLWNEWKSLQEDRAIVRATSVVGYIGINPAPQFAEPPKNWIHDESDRTFLWSGWEGPAGHSWFTAGKGDLDPSLLEGPMGRDVQRAIDRPIVEINGGLRWDRIVEEAPVVGLKLGKSYTVYPMAVLHKVLIVNDQVDSKSVAVIFTPFSDTDRCVNVYDATVGSTRLTFGTSGYFYRRFPLLYDRPTESLWLCDGRTMRALSGHYKGVSLAQLAHPTPEPWSSCQWRHPQTRLVVGADRSKKLASLR